MGKKSYDSKREQNVLLEKVYSEVKTIGEGHGILAKNIDEIKDTLHEHETRFDRIETAVGEIKTTLKEHDRRFDRIETVVTENSKDIKVLKTDVSGLKTDVKRIEHKLDIVTINHEQRIQKLEAAH